MVSALGVQIIADMYGCDPALLDDEDSIRRHMIEAAQRCGATVVSACFHHFSPHGVSGVVVIAESHLAIHTWPEHGYVALDLFTCGDSLNPEACFSYLRDAFHSQQQTINTILRGSPTPLGKEKIGT
jgi:S-adenosylmethionine decarboxylase proenzyme